MIGATLGGGVGRYNGLHGMILDSLRRVRIVTASGDIINASTTENSDLFWGIRGAGFNYGILVSAEYRVYDLTSKQVMKADMVFPASANATILKYLKSYETDLPAKLSIILLGGYNEAYGGVRYLVPWVFSCIVLTYLSSSALSPHKCRICWVVRGGHSFDSAANRPSSYPPKYYRGVMERPGFGLLFRSRGICPKSLH